MVGIRSHCSLDGSCSHSPKSLRTMIQKKREGDKTIVIFLLPSEILITLEVLSVRSAIALPSDFKGHVRNDGYFTHPFSFFNLFPKEISNSVRRLAVYIILSFSFMPE